MALYCLLSFDQIHFLSRESDIHCSVPLLIVASTDDVRYEFNPQEQVCVVACIRNIPWSPTLLFRVSLRPPPLTNRMVVKV